MLANQLARIQGLEIQTKHIEDATASQAFLQRFKAVFEKYHFTTQAPNEVDQLAMQDVKKLIKPLYRLQQNPKETVTVNGIAYNYEQLQKAVGGDNHTRAQIIEPLIKVIMGWSMQVPTSNAPQNTSQNTRTYNPQNSGQDQRRDEAGPSTQFTHEELDHLKKEVKELREFRSNFKNVDGKKLQQLLNQQQKAPYSYETLVAGSGNGQQQVQALAGKHVRDHEYSAGADVSLKEFLAYQELSNRMAGKVVHLEEEVFGSTSSSSRQAKKLSGRSDESSTSASVNAPVKRLGHRQDIRSTALDIVAHYGRVELSRLLLEKGAQTLRHRHPNEAFKVAKEVAERNGMREEVTAKKRWLCC